MTRNEVLAKDAVRQSWDGGWFAGTALAAFVVSWDEPFSWGNVALISACVAISVWCRVRANRALRGIA